MEHLPSIHKLPKSFVMRAAEISTAHITAEDGARLRENGPEVLAVISGGHGHIVHFGDGTDDADIDHDFAVYSPAFRSLLYTLRGEGFSYVRLDPDGATCRDLPTFEW